MITADFVEKFTKTIKKGGIKERIDNKEKLFSGTDIQVYKDAIWQGYLDACRTFSGNTLSKDDERIGELANKIKSYIDADIGTPFCHHDYCKILIDDGKMTYGQAQKIVNMAFKYLYCLVDICSGYNEIEKKFDECHMPLDSIMLEWIRRNIKPSDAEIQRSKMGAWSKLAYSDFDGDIIDGHYTYNYYVNIINEYCSNNGKTPLQIDFENWQKMSLILAAKEFLKVLNNIDSPDDKLAELIEEIKKIGE